ncbi:Regulatory-associated protein of mTOR, partial [Takifugu flavidus]
CCCDGKSSDDVERQPRAATVHCGSNPRWLRPCGSAEEVLLGEIPAVSCGFRENYCTRTVAGVQEKPALPPCSAGCGRNAEPWGEDRAFPCKPAPVQFAFDGFDILYRLWTLPYNFLTRIICATVSVIVRRRRSSSARVDHHTATRALMKMDADLLHAPAVGLTEEEEADMNDWKLPLAFMKKRHAEKIEGSKALAQSWRMKDRMKTVSVALVLCLNVGVDPPDVVKTSPCARLECWIDPLSMSPQKALETIGANLQKQYENWQPRREGNEHLGWIRHIPGDPEGRARVAADGPPPIGHSCGQQHVLVGEEEAEEWEGERRLRPKDSQLCCNRPRQLTFHQRRFLPPVSLQASAPVSSMTGGWWNTEPNTVAHLLFPLLLTDHL